MAETWNTSEAIRVVQGSEDATRDWIRRGEFFPSAGRGVASGTFTRLDLLALALMLGLRQQGFEVRFAGRMARQVQEFGQAELEASVAEGRGLLVAIGTEPVSYLFSRDDLKTLDAFRFAVASAPLVVLDLGRLWGNVQRAIERWEARNASRAPVVCEEIDPVPAEPAGVG